MKIKKINFITLIFVLFFCNIFSQQKTPYQNKIDQLYSTYFRALQIDESLIHFAKKSNDWSIITKSREFSNAVHSSNKNLIITLTSALEAKIKDAEKLKNATDLKNDLIKKEIEKNELELIKLKKEKELLIKEKLLKEKKFENSDYNNIVNNIESEFSNWLEKGEFEKKENFIDRIQNKSKSKFDAICYEKILKRIEEKDKISPSLNFEKYNSEEEYFNFNIIINELKITDTLKVNINDAENFKKGAYLAEINEKENDWHFIEYEIFPKFLVLKYLDKIVKKIKISNQNEMKLNFSSKNFTSEVLSIIKSGLRGASVVSFFRVAT